MPTEPLTIGVIGLWHLGSVYSAALAELGHTVIGFDADATTVEKLQNDILPVQEEGLLPLIQRNKTAGRLSYTHDLADLGEVRVFLVAIDTPCDKEHRPDLSSIRELFTVLAPKLRDGSTVIVSSQVPVGSGEEFQTFLRTARPKLHFSYIYLPENLQLGTALQSFFHPARIVAGVSDPAAEALIKRIFSPINAPLLCMTVPSAEMVKHALNAFLATSLSFIYDIADMCEAYGADVLRVSEALKSDARIGHSAYLDASIGFSGATLGRDLTALVLKGGEKGITLPVISGAREKNEERWERILPFLRSRIPRLKSVTIGILGLAYKPNTSTLRDSLSLKVMEALKTEVKELRVHDPMVRWEEAKEAGVTRLYPDPYVALTGTSAVLVMTAWADYAKLDWKRIAPLMTPPKLLFDAKNFLWKSEAKIKASGIMYAGVGRGIGSGNSRILS